MRPPGHAERRPAGAAFEDNAAAGGESRFSFPHETPVVVDGALSRLVHDARDLTAAFNAGRLYQDAHRIEAAAETRAHEMILAQSSEWQRWARALALKKGPAWAAMIDEASEL